MKKVFFLETRTALDRITKLFDIIHPLFLSYKAHRVKVTEFIQRHPEATDTDYKTYFNIDYPRINFRKYFIEENEEDMEDELSWMILTNLFAIYEGWLEELIVKLNVLESHKIIMNLQFPDRFADALNLICQQTDSMMENAFKTKLIEGNERFIYPSASLMNHLICYRFFKELRNSNTHQDRRITQRVIQTHTSFLGVQNTLRQMAMINFPNPILEEKYKLSLQMVGAFCDVLIDIIYTYDINISATALAKEYLYNSLKNFNHPISQFGNISVEEAKERCARICQAAGFVKPFPTDALYLFLYNNYIVH